MSNNFTLSKKNKETLQIDPFSATHSLFKLLAALRWHSGESLTSKLANTRLLGARFPDTHPDRSTKESA
jgi:hypothetical protein|tara:strand:- start:303 stop:509 length:207 start_codon:yes stop_codon:yes gene_type:complete